MQAQVVTKEMFNVTRLEILDVNERRTEQMEIKGE